MNRDTKNLAFGGFFGGFIAALLGLAIARQHGLGLWTIVPVALLGGCIGWLACGFAGAKRSVQIAWRQVVGWKPDVVWWKDLLLLGGTPFSLVFSLFFWLLLPRLFWEGTPLFHVIEITGVSFGAGTFSAVVLMLAAILCGEVKSNEEDKALYKMVLRRWNIVTFPFSFAWYFRKGALCDLRKVPFAAKTIGKFMWRVFALAHSDMRRICFIGTTLGTGIGFYLGYVNQGNLVLWAFLSGVLGAILSVAWREVVAVRWLGLKNAQYFLSFCGIYEASRVSSTLFCLHYFYTMSNLLTLAYARVSRF